MYTNRWHIVRHLIFLVLAATAMNVFGQASLTEEERMLKISAEEKKIERYVDHHMRGPVPIDVHPLQFEGEEGFTELSAEERADIQGQWIRGYWRAQYFKEHPDARGVFKGGGMPSCNNGDFEQGSVTYGGEFGLYSSGECDAAGTIAFSPISGALGSDVTMFELTNNVVDPFVGGLNQTNNGSGHAIRINSPRGSTTSCTPSRGVNKLTKAITLTQPNQTIAFFFALVLLDPNDGSHLDRRPFFNVRALDANDQVMDEFCRVADADNAFFSVLPEDTWTFSGCSISSSEIQPIVWAPWDCTILNVGGEVGDVVTLEFVTADCGLGAHWGYAYVDDICAICTTPLSGLVQLDPFQECLDGALR